MTRQEFKMHIQTITKRNMNYKKLKFPEYFSLLIKNCVVRNSEV